MKRKNKWLIGIGAIALGVYALWPSNDENLESKVEEPVKESRFDRAEMRKRFLEINKRIKLPKEEVAEEDSDLPSCLRCEDWKPKIKREWYDKEETKKKSEAPCVCGEKHGREKTWYKTGGLKSTQEYVCGVCEGERIEWHENGQLKTQYMMTNNHPVSNEVLFWHENGNVAYIKEDLGNGCERLRHWYENGQKERLATFCGSNREGEWISWHPNGQKEEELNYADGFLDGRQTKWGRNGLIKSEVNYNKGILHGDFKRFNSEEELIFEGRYVNGKLEEATEFDDNGRYHYPKENIIQ